MLVCLKSLAGKDADVDGNFEDDQEGLESEGSEVEDVQDQPSLDMSSLQAIGEYFVTSQAFSQYKQRLHRFLHPDHGKEDKSADVQAAHHDRKEHRMDAPRTVEPGAKTFTDTGTEHSLDDQNEWTRNQADERLSEHKGNFQESLPGSSRMQGCRMPWERDSFSTWVAKWVTDILWPPSNGYQRMWYFCVSESCWYCFQHVPYKLFAIPRDAASTHT